MIVWGSLETIIKTKKENSKFETKKGTKLIVMIKMQHILSRKWSLISNGYCEFVTTEWALGRQMVTLECD